MFSGRPWSAKMRWHSGVFFVTFAENPWSKRHIFILNIINTNHAYFAFFIEKRRLKCDFHDFLDRCLVDSRKYGTCLVANPEVCGRSFPQTHVLWTPLTQHKWQMSCGRTDTCTVGPGFVASYCQMSCGHASIHLLGHMSCGNGGTSWTHVRWHLVS